jgi:hypothetical protein
MSSTTQEQLLSFFRHAAGASQSETPGANQFTESSGGESVDAASGTAALPASGTGGGQSYSSTTVGASFAGGAESAQNQGGTGASIESGFTTFLEGGLGIVPLVSGLMGLFGGGSSSPPPLEKYQKASSIDFVSADTPSGLAAADYDQLGMPRLADTPAPTSTAASNSPASSSAVGDPGASGNSTLGTMSGAGQSGTAAPQMTLNIQALDAQSIMDRSGDIAQAVRRAMLNMSSINDVISDL